MKTQTDIMYNPQAELVNLDDILAAQQIVNASPHCRRTPLLQNAHLFLDLPESLEAARIHLKLENMQVTGSYKVRGVTNQLSQIPPGWDSNKHPLISYSAGNYGKAFAYLTSKLGHKALVLLPKTAPTNRTSIIESFGAATERHDSCELQSTVDRYVKERGMLFCHSFDDVRLIAGHASLGLEILEECGDPDVVLVPCGGGALLAGVASVIKLSGHSRCRVYGIEPEGACTMYKSLLEGVPVGMTVNTVAAGLAPPFAGPNSFHHCQERVDDIFLVSDQEILRAMYLLYDKGLVVEPSGAAAFAALIHGKVPGVQGQKVIVVVTGGNVTPAELTEYSVRLDT